VSVTPGDIVPVETPVRRRWWHRIENGLTMAALAAMMLLPVAEVLLRAFFRGGIKASVPLVQHLVLAVCMLGGAIAARDGRLLSFSGFSRWLDGRWAAAATVVGGACGGLVSALLCRASVEFVGNSRILGKTLAYGIPLWWVQSLLVVGFGLIAVRLFWRASPGWGGRAAALALAGLELALVLSGHWEPSELRWPLMALLLFSLACGVPVFTFLGGAALLLLWSGGEPMAPVPLKHYNLTINPTLPSIPLFTLAGYFLAEGGAAKRLVRLFQAFFGAFRGGPAIVTTLVCAFFTSFTGASGATILALGGVLMPVLLAAGYKERPSLGLLTGAGSLGMLFPPCLPPILYAIVASSSGVTGVTMQDMFKGGLLPGLLLVLMTAWWGVRSGPVREEGERRRFEWREAAAAAWAAKGELLVPVVAIVSLFSGYATPVEASAITAFYTFVLNVFIHRDLSLIKDAPRVIKDCGVLVGGVLLILGVALGFTHYLVDAEIPDQAVAWATASIHSKWLFLLVLNFVLLVIGGLVEIYAAIVVVVPLLVPVGEAFGLHPIHLGIIFLANMELGFLAPPVGLNLLLASYRFNKPIAEVTRASLPMLALMAVGVLLITYLPWLSTWLPQVWH
jgi:tripartite ATP-independent transporter DctM subunit